MSDAYLCDLCGEYDDGDPLVSLDLGITVEQQTGLLSGLVETDANPSVTLDFCSVHCIQEYPVGAKRDDLLRDTNAKDRLLEEVESQ
jgi:hypothetical protein